MENKTSPQRMTWTSDRVRRFWDYWGQRPDADATYFSAYYAEALTHLVAQQRQIRTSRILDYGGGVGHLSAALMDRGAHVALVDQSPKSVENAGRRFGQNRHFLGASRAMTFGESSFDARFDAVFMVETLEHLFEEEREDILRAAASFLKPGGQLIVTVPNREDLERSRTFCPACEHDFHRWQHMSSWDHASLTGLLYRVGFIPQWCRAVRLERFQGPPRGDPVHDMVGKASRIVSRMTRQLEARWTRPIQDQFWLNWRASEPGDHLVAISKLPPDAG